MKIRIQDCLRRIQTFLVISVVLLLGFNLIASEIVNQDERYVTVVAVGDILLDRGPNGKIEKYGEKYPFEKVKKYLESADIAFGNLECPIAKCGVAVIKPFCFRAKPERVKSLIYAGLDIVSLANNHTLDYGRDALLETMEILKKNGIKYAGAGKSSQEAHKPSIIEKNGLKIAFLAYSIFISDGGRSKKDSDFIAYIDSKAIAEDISNAKKTADVIIVSFHWGDECVDIPSKSQKNLAHLAIDNGASIILGHHPHVLQGFEVYKGKVIAYSLGNFVFDSRRPKAKESMIFKCRLSKTSILEVSFIPVEIIGFRPVVPSETRSLEIFRRLKKISPDAILAK